jgi:hypothetical protein
MVWVRLDDGFPHHPKALLVGPYGRDLFVSGLCYANRFLTDGFIPGYALHQLAPGLPNAKRVAATLVEAAFWETCEGGWRIHDYHGFQPSASEVRAAKERALAIRSAGGKARAATATRVEGRFAPAAAPEGDQQAAGDSAGQDGHQQHQQETSSDLTSSTSARPVPSRIKYLVGDSSPTDGNAPKKRPKKNGKGTHPNVKLVIEAYHQSFLERHGTPPPINGAKCGAIARTMLRGRPPEEAVWAVREFFKNPPAFYRDKGLWGVEHILAAMPTLLARRAELERGA